MNGKRKNSSQGHTVLPSVLLTSYGVMFGQHFVSVSILNT